MVFDSMTHISIVMYYLDALFLEVNIDGYHFAKERTSSSSFSSLTILNDSLDRLVCTPQGDKL